MDNSVVTMPSFSSGTATCKSNPVFTAATAVGCAGVLLFGSMYGSGRQIVSIVSPAIQDVQKIITKNAYSKKVFSSPYGFTIYAGEDERDANRRLRNAYKLDSMERFQKNWNGYGADPFSKVLIKRVRSILEEIVFQPEVFPVAGGAIQLEYDNGDDYLEFEINAKDRVHVFQESHDGEQREYDIPEDIDEINKVVKKFYE